MALKICAFAALALLGCVHQAYGQEADECFADSVVNLTLTTGRWLNWAVKEDEPCKIDQFLVYIYQRDKPIEYSFEVDEPGVDVTFLKICEDWIFVVVPVSGHTRGREHRLFGSVPLPPEADLSISYINVTRNGITGDLHLSWDLTESVYGSCSLRYRVTIEVEGSEIIHDIYQSDRSVNLHFLSPCTTYQFGIRAINIASPTVEGPLRWRLYDYPAAPQQAPRLQAVDLSTNHFNMTWEVQNRVRNNCEVQEFLIAGGSYFNVTIIYDDKPSRDHLQLRVGYLKPSSMYYMRASVRNTAGWSEPAVVAVQTLDYSPDKQVEPVA